MVYFNIDTDYHCFNYNLNYVFVLQFYYFVLAFYNYFFIYITLMSILTSTLHKMHNVFAFDTLRCDTQRVTLANKANI